MLARFCADFYPAPAPASLPTYNKMHAHMPSLLTLKKANIAASAKTKQQRGLKKRTFNTPAMYLQ